MNEKELTHIDLFSGIGGFTLAGEWAGFRTIVFCEKEEFCQKVLQKRFGAVIADSESMERRNGVAENKGKKPRKINSFSNKAPLLIPEIRDFDGTKWRGTTLLTGGFPCQPFSVAGPRTGKEDDRYLWPEMLRVINEAKPRWILAENVPGIFRMALDTVLADLEGEGYSTGTFIIPACGLNAPHRRNRVWIIAYSIRTRARSENRTTDDKKGQARKNRREGIRQRDGEIGTGRLDSTNSDAPNSQCLGRQEGARKRTEYEKQVSKRQDFGDGNSKGTAPDSEGKQDDARKQSDVGGAEKTGRSINPAVVFGNQYAPDPEGTECKRSGRTWTGRKRFTDNAWQEDWHEVATRFCRVDDGLPAWIHSHRVARLKALGNAIVPQIAYEILKRIAWIENERIAD